MHVTGQYPSSVSIYVGVTDQYHKAPPVSRDWRSRQRGIKVMSSQQATALRQPDADTTTGASHLLSPYRLGELTLKNRLVMSPMTRSRAVEGNVPNPLAATYYAQRASAGLIVTEATQVSPQGVGYIRTPGIHSPAQIAGWRGDGCGASCGGQDFRAALACGPRFAPGFSRWRAAGRALRHRGRGPGVHRPRTDP